MVTLDNIIFGYLIHDGQWPNTFRPSSTLLDVGGPSHVELQTKKNPTLGGTLVKGCTPSAHGNANNEKVYILIKHSILFYINYMFSYALI